MDLDESNWNHAQTCVPSNDRTVLVVVRYEKLIRGSKTDYEYIHEFFRGSYNPNLDIYTCHPHWFIEDVGNIPKEFKVMSWTEITCDYV
jgi:hypothetical protein